MPPETSNDSSSKSKIGLIIAIIVILGIIFFIFTGSSKTEKNEVATTNTVATVDDQGKSLKDILASGGAEMCTFSNSTDVSESSGTIYVSMGMMRGDFDSISKPTNTKVTSHMMMDGKTNYVWTSESNQGFKMPIDAVTSGATGAQATEAAKYSAVDYNQKMNYNCAPWTVDKSLFALPKGVTFMDMSAMMKGAIPNGMPNIPTPPGVPNTY